MSAFAEADTPTCPPPPAPLGQRLDQHRRAECGHECDPERADRRRHSDADAHRRAGLNDTHAIANASYAIAVTDTAANVSANIDALNADTHVTSIALTDSGTQVLTLAAAQALDDTRALATIGPYTITIVDTAADPQALAWRR